MLGVSTWLYKLWDHVAAITLLVTKLLCTLSQETVCLSYSKRRFLKMPFVVRYPPDICVICFILIFHSIPPYLFNHLKVITSWKILLPVTTTIILYIAHNKVVYLSADDVPRLCRPIPAFYTVNILRVPTTGERVLIFQRKDKAKRFSSEIFWLQWMLFPYLLLCNAKYLLRLNYKYHCVVTLLRIFSSAVFGEKMKRPIFQNLYLIFYLF